MSSRRRIEKTPKRVCNDPKQQSTCVKRKLNGISDSEDDEAENNNPITDEENAHESDLANDSLESNKLDTSIDSMESTFESYLNENKPSDKDTDIDVESSDSKQKQTILLDVLAQVASDTLALEPNIPPPQKKRLTLRAIQTMDVLDLDQIRNLTDKSLVNLFSDMSSDEIKRLYSFTCYLMPRKCKSIISSFGNEMKARLHMCQHLRNHIDELTLEYNDLSKHGRINFTAEPLHLRRRRAMAISNAAKLKIKKCRLQSNVGSINEDIEKEMKAIKKPRTNLLNKKITLKKRGKKVSRVNRRDVDAYESESTESALIDVENFKDEYVDIDQIIVNKMQKLQPHLDHCYTTIFGKRKNQTEKTEISEDDMDTESSVRTNGKRSTKTKTHHQPVQMTKTVHGLIQADDGANANILPVNEFSRQLADGTLLYEEEVVDIAHESSSAIRPYPPMPKSELAKKGKLFVPEESILSSADEAERDLPESVVYVKRKLVKMAKSREGSLEWEKKLALKCIRELRFKRKDDKVQLICKICKNKTFTAAATLMYHYRSHAGIKPFVCLICNTTFTRQHSLNYHMLIHNNQSRFTCQDCGRKFRHPSHFKEHIRRHTGETPFLCTDCPMKFKTRNTYKRHLRTRHGKLLTAAGIHIMSAEEFKKHKTKPYRKRRTQAPFLYCPVSKSALESDGETSDSNESISIKAENFDGDNHERNREEAAISSATHSYAKADTSGVDANKIVAVVDNKKDSFSSKNVSASVSSTIQVTASLLNTSVVSSSKVESLPSTGFMPTISTSDVKTISTPGHKQYIVTQIPNILPSGPATEGLLQHGFIPQTLIQTSNAASVHHIQKEIVTSLPSAISIATHPQFASPALMQAAEQFRKQQQASVAVTITSSNNTVQKLVSSLSTDKLFQQPQQQQQQGSVMTTLDQISMQPSSGQHQQSIPQIFFGQQQITPLLLQTNSAQNTLQNLGNQFLIQPQPVSQSGIPVLIGQLPNVTVAGNQVLLQQVPIAQGSMQQTMPFSVFQQNQKQADMLTTNCFATRFPVQGPRASLQIQGSTSKVQPSVMHSRGPVHTLIGSAVLANIAGANQGLSVVQHPGNGQHMIQTLNTQPQQITGANVSGLLSNGTIFQPLNVTSRMVPPQVANMNLTSDRGFPYVHSVGVYNSSPQTALSTAGLPQTPIASNVSQPEPAQLNLQQAMNGDVVPVMLPSIASVLPSATT